MSTVICEPPQTAFSTSAYKKQRRRLHLSFGSTSESSSKSTLLSIVTPEYPPIPSRNGDSMASTPGVRAHAHPSSTRVNTAGTPDVIHHDRPRQHNVGERTEVPFPLRASGHTRTQSTSAVGEPSAVLGSSSARHSRARAASSATIGFWPRSRARLPSILTSVLTQSKAPVQPRESANDPELVGSFTPTSSPRPRLRSLLAGAPPAEFSGAPTPSRFVPSQPTPQPRSLSTPRSHSLAHRPRRRSDAPLSSLSMHRRAVEASPIDPPASPDLPSICRTPSSYSGSEYFPTAPSSAGPPTPVHAVTTLPVRESRKSESSLHPVLENLENTSMFRVQTACSTCGKRGSNFPCCPKCGEMWCSRPCRLQNGNGKRHICAKNGA
ncbi:hypothetical protein DICSQDRAFT_179383 [Dichomitus squalens LYAD-421 SS1]|uniref:uncharacterized protein n=1 Tax=Dichomitus squalens (strain LYAD-421) TaxID=732165 RepID=UPI0004415F0A|nr:uncharacterized protein DICSQDRAFT_179383 [Dichomitus squalens LYAD-421 SS1]EJF63410.1 hypothetical protein DICSQDRAFT_179383 [Dichomitus squalens LYAD-421 SS1]